MWQIALPWLPHYLTASEDFHFLYVRCLRCDWSASFNKSATMEAVQAEVSLHTHDLTAYVPSEPDKQPQIRLQGVEEYLNTPAGLEAVLALSPHTI